MGESASDGLPDIALGFWGELAEQKAKSARNDADDFERGASWGRIYGRMEIERHERLYAERTGVAALTDRLSALEDEVDRLKRELGR